MECYLYILIFGFFASFFITHMIWKKDFTDDKLSKAYFGKFLWGFRTFLFPTISLVLLLQYDLRIYCIALLFWSCVNLLLRKIFQEEDRRSAFRKLGLFWYMFCALSLIQNNPYWIQIWPSIIYLAAFITAIFAGILGKSAQLTKMLGNVENLSVKQINVLNRILPFYAILTFGLNECFRTQFSFEAWAFYRAFETPVFVLLVGLGTVIFVPIFVREKES